MVKIFITCLVSETAENSFSLVSVVWGFLNCLHAVSLLQWRYLNILFL